MNNQTFKYAGYSTMANGTAKARFGNDIVSRIKKLKDNTDLHLVELPTAMTKKEAAQYLLDTSSIPSVEIQTAILKVINRSVPKTARVVNSSPTVNGAITINNVRK